MTGYMSEFFRKMIMLGIAATMLIIVSACEEEVEVKKGNTLQPSRFAYATGEGNNELYHFTYDSVAGEVTLQNTYASSGTVPLMMEVHPSGSFLYVANNGSSQVIAYSIDGVTGNLTEISPYTVTLDPWNILISPNGKHLYVSHLNEATVTVMEIDQGTGALTPITTVSTPSTVGTMAFHPNGMYLYVPVMEGSIYIFSYDSVTGGLTPTVDSPATATTNPLAISFSPDGSIAYTGGVTGSIEGFSVDGTTGALTNIAGSTLSVDATGMIFGVMFHPALPVLFVPVMATSGNVFTYSMDGGGLPVALGTPQGVGGGGPKMNLDGLRNFAFVTDYTNNQFFSLAVDSATGALSPHPTTPTFNTPTSALPFEIIFVP